MLGNRLRFRLQKVLLQSLRKARIKLLLPGNPKTCFNSFLSLVTSRLRFWQNARGISSHYGDILLRWQFISPKLYRFSVPIPTEMRTTPAINASDFNIISDVKGNQTGFSISVVNMSSNALRVRAKQRRTWSFYC